MPRYSNEVVVLNLDRTLTHGEINSALGDAGAAGLEVPDPIGSPSYIDVQRAQLLGALAQGSTERIESFVEKTAEGVADRLAPWAHLYLETVEEPVVLVSLPNPQPLVEGWGRGLARTISGLRIRQSLGAQPLADQTSAETAEDSIIGETGVLLKSEVVSQLSREGLSPAVVADSYTYAVLAQATRAALAVNPSHRLEKMISKDVIRHEEGEFVPLNPDKLVRIHWKARPATTALLRPGEEEPTEFDLRNRPSDRADFVRMLSRFTSSR